jgi:hypothetical protein
MSQDYEHILLNIATSKAQNTLHIANWNSPTQNQICHLDILPQVLGSHPPYLDKMK